jgi:hypothetical protein
MVPTPNLVIPVGFASLGALNFAGTWPNGLPPGAQRWIQAWIVDITAPAGLSATNGVLASTP